MPGLAPLRAVIALLVLSACGSPDPIVRVTVDARAAGTPISPYVYGVNGLELAASVPRGTFTLARLGGNRTSTYNWENDASNGGEDFDHQNDGYFASDGTPASAVITFATSARALDMQPLVTVPLLDRVAADRRITGDIAADPDPRSRVRRSLLRCPDELGRAPDPTDDHVCQEHFVAHLESALGPGALWYALDNEPAAWPRVHPRLRGSAPLTYRELVARSREAATMLRERAPRARIFGPVSFGWPEMMRLANAPDAADRDFLPFYLSSMRDGDRSLVDVLDVHWYPDARVGDAPVASASRAPEVARVRMQLPRSLYDTSYVEPSWITRDWLGGEPVRLLSRLRELAPAIAITEWHYGGGDDLSGAVAAADVLGALGAHGVFAAALWPLFDQQHRFAVGAFRMFRALDDDGTRFGDRSLPARSSDLARVSAWASRDGERVVIVLVVRDERPLTIELAIAGHGPARVFALDPTTALPVPRPAIAPTASRYRVPTSGIGVLTLVLDPLS